MATCQKKAVQLRVDDQGEAEYDVSALDKMCQFLPAV